jgi:hypothetical protein
MNMGMWKTSEGGAGQQQWKMSNLGESFREAEPASDSAVPKESVSWLFFRPFWGFLLCRFPTHGLRRGLYSFAASRLGLCA